MPIGATIAGVAGAVGSIGSAAIGSSAAKDAANVQAQSALSAQQFQASEAEQARLFESGQADKATADQLKMFGVAQGALQPYNAVGTGAINTLGGLYGIHGTGAGSGTPSPQSLNAFTSSPDYAFALQQGTQAMQRSAAAGGTLISGGQLKAGQEFGQGLASQQYGNYYNRLLSLAQIGQTSASGISNAAITTGGQMGNALTSAGAQVGNTLSNAGAQVGNSIQAGGQATASGIVGSANAWSGGLSGATGGIAQAALLSRMGGGSGQSLSSYAADKGWTNGVGSGGFNYSDAAAA